MASGRLYFLIFVIFNLIVVPSCFGFSHNFTAHRGVQFDYKGGNYGSRKTNLNAALAALNARNLGGNQTVKASRSAMMISIEELEEDKVVGLLSSSSTGVIVLLPSGPPSDKARGVMRRIEHELVAKSFSIPVYFVVEDEELASTQGELLSRLQSSPALWSDQYTAVVAEKEAEEIKKPTVATLQGTLAGSVSADAPTLVFAAPYDFWGAVPSAPAGVDINGSGVAALLELARLFHRLYKSNAKSKYNLVFLLSGGGRADYSGTRQWLHHETSQNLDNIEFVLCLEGVAGPNLNFHVTRRTPKDARVKQLFDTFESKAASLDIPFSFVHKKINLSHTETKWEHEHFSFKRISAATLSGAAESTTQLLRGSALDTHVNQETFERNVKFIAQTVATYIYGEEVASATLGEGSALLNKLFLSSWMEYFAEVPRPMVGVQESPYYSTLHKLLSKYTDTVVEHRDELKTEYKFFDKFTVEMRVHRTKPLVFDLLLLIPVLGYLLGLAVFLRGTKVIGEIVEFVRERISGGSKKAKN